MSKKSSSKTHSNKKPEATEKQAAESSEDPDFWDFESTEEELEATAEEKEELKRVEKMLAERTQNPQLKSLSEQEPTLELPCDKDVISSLDIHGSNTRPEELPDIANKNVDELLASATADAMSVEDTNTSEQLQKEPEPAIVKTKTIMTPIEKIASLACYLLILGVFGYLIHYASNQHDFSTANKYDSNVPVQGEFAEIERIDTWWSKPVSNNTKFGVVLVPSATITLGPGSTSGVIRCVFYSYEEGLKGQLKPKGDPFTHEFEDGKFLDSGTNQVTIHGTDGYEELAHFLYYKSQDEERWTVDVKEAPSTQTAVNSFEPLATAPIEPLRK